MLRIVRGTKDDIVHCPGCKKETAFRNGAAPIICNECSSLLPDADELALAKNVSSRVAYFLDEDLYD